MRSILLGAAVVACGFCQGTGDAPPVVQIVCKPGIATNVIRRYASARAAVNVLGMAAVTGLPQSWMVEMHPNFGSLEDLDRALRAVDGARWVSDTDTAGQDDLIAPPRTLTAVLRVALSYHPDQAIRALPKARYMRVTVHHVRPGLEPDFATSLVLRQLTNDTINLDRPELVYQVMSGAPSSTYVLFSPLSTLRGLDEGVPDLPAYAAPIADARAKAAPKAADFLINREHLLFRLEPGLSYVSDDFAAGDPQFWRGTASGQ
jgi:hypothetical protein